MPTRYMYDSAAARPQWVGQGARTVSEINQPGRGANQLSLPVNIPAAHGGTSPSAPLLIEAEVVLSPPGYSPPVKGINYGNRFYAVDLPPEIEAGEKVKLLVAERKDGLVFTYIETKGASDGKEINKALPSLLNELGLSDSASVALKQLLRTSPEISISRPALVAPNLTKSIERLLSEHGVVSEEEMGDAPKLAEKLAAYQPRAAHELSVILSKHRQVLESSLLGKHLDRIYDLSSKLESFLKLLPGEEALPNLRSNASARSAQASASSFVHKEPTRVPPPLPALNLILKEAMEVIDLAEQTAKTERLNAVYAQIHSLGERFRPQGEQLPRQDAALVLRTEAVIAALKRDSSSEISGDMRSFYKQELEQLAKEVESAAGRQAVEKRVLKAAAEPSENATSRFFKVLSAIGAKSDELIQSGEKLFKMLIRSQIDLIRQVESTVKALLVASPSEGGVEMLLNTLRRIPTVPNPGDGALQQLFKQFVAEFRGQLENVLQSGDGASLRELLLSKLEIMRVELNLPSIEDRFVRGSSEAGQLSRTQMNALRSIEAQALLLLESEAPLLVKGAATESGGLPHQLSPQFEIFLKLVRREIESLPRSEESNAAAILHRFNKGVNELLAGNEAIPDKESALRLLIADAAKGLHTSLGHASSVESLADTQLSSLKLIYQQIIAILEASDRGAALISRELQLKELTAGLKEALRGAAAIIPDPRNPMEQELVQLSADLLSAIEDYEHFGRDAAKLGLQLRQGLEQIRGRIFAAATQEEPSLTALEPKAVQMLENFVAGQEMLSRMAPAMKALGEPILALFPFVMHGLLSKMELAVKLPRPQVGADKEREKRSAKQPYETISLKLPLPDLGNVSVEIARRTGEVMINFGFEQKRVADFVGAKLPVLESILKANGYEHVGMKVDSVIGSGDSIDMVKNTEQRGIIA
ncbi:MAG: flagellar hook-length control protein FliK [Deltaproteobacteria bacterium]|nr:flagellar hook-length control protein FliK [Deltaproteobacteria bacterium]